MDGAILYGPKDVRFEEREDPKITHPTDAIIRTVAAWVCGSDPWPYRGIETYPAPQPMGHEYVGVVEEVGTDVRNIKPGQFVVGSFFASDNSCPICQAGFQGRCVHAAPIGMLGAQANYLRIPLADGTLVPTPGTPPDDLIPSLLSASDVLGTVWFAADAAASGPGKTVAVVGGRWTNGSPVERMPPNHCPMRNFGYTSDWRNMKSVIMFAFVFTLSLMSLFHATNAQPRTGNDQPLNAREQNIVSISALTAAGDLNQLRKALNQGLDSSLTVNEIKDVLVQMYAYSGFPQA